jgi:hypothetical protein
MGKIYRIKNKLYKNLVFTLDGDLAVCLQAGLQIGGYEAELVGDTVRGKEGFRIVIGIDGVVNE